MKYPSIAILDLIGLVYDGDTLSNRGLGGSESAVILMSKELANLGFPVTVFNACQDDDSRPGIYSGVTYRPVSSLTNNEHFDIVISSRTVVPFVPEHYYSAYNDATAYQCSLFESIRKNAKYKVLWMHDTFCKGDINVEDLAVQGYIDKIFTLSDFHTTYVTTCDHGKRRNFEVLKDKIFQTRNAVVQYFDEVDVSKKDPDLFVFNASVTKGMLPLIDRIWPKIKANFPQAKLKVIGGYYKFRSDAPLDAQGETHQKLIQDQRYKALGIEFTGIITQKEIAEILSEASMFLYPGAFPETFGISTLESLTYNTPLVATRFGALEETAIDNASYFIDYAIEPNSLFRDIDIELQCERFAGLAMYAYNNRYLHQQKQYYCNVIKDIHTWDTVALQWKQHFFRQLDLYLPVDEYRKVSYINDKVHRIFGRRFSNKEEWNTYKQNVEQPIAIVTPFYNAINYLEKCIDSVATQDYNNWHMYLINDCSTDNSLDMAYSIIKHKYPNLIKNFTLVDNKKNKGAVYNQINTLRNILGDDTIVMLLDGDDSLKNDNNIFHFYNNLFADNKTEYAYGSCWSEVDDIPLIAQPYPKSVRESKTYREHKFNWGMPYPHLRVFKKKLIDQVDDSVFKDSKGKWYKAGGDNATFYNIIEQADPNKVVAVQEIMYNYNDKNPLNDYKVNGDIQNKNAASIAGNKRVETMIDTKPEIVMVETTPEISYTDQILNNAQQLRDNHSIPKPASEYLRKLKEQYGVEPKVIFDIGACVMHWTDAAKAVWPDSQYVLFEANPYLCEYLTLQGMDNHCAVLGDQDGKQVTFYQNDWHPAGSSYYIENFEASPWPEGTINFIKQSKPVTIELQTVDTIVAQRGFPAPDLIKMDIQGAELDALKGMTETLKTVNHIILELQHVEYNKGAPLKGSVIDYMNSIGFELVSNYSSNGPDGDYHFVRSTIGFEGLNRKIDPNVKMVATKEIYAKNVSQDTKTILIAIPTAKNIEPTTFKAIHDLIIPDGYQVQFQHFYGYSIDQVRNLIADWVVKGYDYLFAVDYDISFAPDTLVKLLSHDKDVVTGIYRQRIYETQVLELFANNAVGGYDHIEWETIKDQGLVEVGACGFGCVLVKKQVLAEIGYPQFLYKHALNHADTFSEDLYFARMAQQKGFRLFADTSILCDHTGTYVFKVQ